MYKITGHILLHPSMFSFSLEGLINRVKVTVKIILKFCNTEPLQTLLKTKFLLVYSSGCILHHLNITLKIILILLL